MSMLLLKSSFWIMYKAGCGLILSAVCVSVSVLYWPTWFGIYNYLIIEERIRKMALLLSHTFAFSCLPCGFDRSQLMAEWSLPHFRTNSQPECICLLCCWKWWICECLCFGSPRHWKFISCCYHFNARLICHKFVYCFSVIFRFHNMLMT